MSALYLWDERSWMFAMLDMDMCLLQGRLNCNLSPNKRRMAFLMFAKTFAKSSAFGPAWSKYLVRYNERAPSLWAAYLHSTLNGSCKSGEAGGCGEEDVVSWCWRRRLAGGQQITMIYVRPRRDWQLTAPLWPRIWWMGGSNHLTRPTILQLRGETQPQSARLTGRHWRHCRQHSCWPGWWIIIQL